MSDTSTDSDGEGSVDFDAVFNVYSKWLYTVADVYIIVNKISTWRITFNTKWYSMFHMLSFWHAK